MLLLTVGCASHLASRQRAEERLPANSRLAVLPFENLSGVEHAAEKVTDYFQVALLGTDRVDAVAYGTVYDELRRLRIRSSTLITLAQIDSLHAALGIDFLVSGSVLEYEEIDNEFLGTIPQVSFNCRLIDCRTGEVVWVGASNGEGDRGEVVFGLGAVKSADNLARDMVSKSVRAIAGLFADR